MPYLLLVMTVDVKFVVEERTKGSFSHATFGPGQ